MRMVNSSIDPYKLLRVLEDVTDKHARTVRSLDKTLHRLRRNPSDEQLQSLALNYIRRLRVLRRRLTRALGEEMVEPDFSGVESEVVGNIATLSEYMIIVGHVYEEELLRKALKLVEKGASILGEDAENIERDLEEIYRLNEKFQRIVDKYY